MPPSRRLAVVTTEIGTRSEVWMMRQMEAFTAFETTLFGWSRADDGVQPPPGVETRLFARGDPRSFSPLGRLSRRLGLAAAYRPGPGTRRQIAADLAAIAPDAILCHFGWNAIAIAPALPPGLPLLLHVHGRDVSFMLETPAYRAALMETLPRVGHLVAVGRFQLKRLEQLGPLPPASLVPCGAPTSLFAARPLPQRDEGQPIRFLSVGRISAEKGVLQSLAAFEAVHAVHPLARLGFVGDGPLLPDLRTAVARSPAAAAIDCFGYLRPDAIAALLARSHVLLQHSREVNGWVEGFGVTLTEGGAAGLPLIASRSGGIPEQVFDGENGFLFEPDDIRSQTAAMLRLATDEPLRRQMGTAARTISVRFDSTTQARRLEALIRELIDGPPHRGASSPA